MCMIIALHWQVAVVVEHSLTKHSLSVCMSIDTKWRKIRTFKLVTGEVQGKTRADRLNEGLKQVRAKCVSGVDLVAY